MYRTVRLVIALVAGALFIGGLVAIATGQTDAAIGGAWLIVTGTVGIVAVAFERTRYRSEASDRRVETPRPGGGEPGYVLEPRYWRTDEVFSDPTSRRGMRVYLDSRTGEPRYRAEG